MSRRTARRQRFYAWQRLWRHAKPIGIDWGAPDGDRSVECWRDAEHRWHVVHSGVTLDELRGVMTDVERMAQEACGIPLMRGEIGHIFSEINDPRVWLTPEQEELLRRGLPIRRDGKPADPERFGVIAIDSAVAVGSPHT